MTLEEQIIAVYSNKVSLEFLQSFLYDVFSGPQAYTDFNFLKHGSELGLNDSNSELITSLKKIDLLIRDNLALALISPSLYLREYASLVIQTDKLKV